MEFNEFFNDWIIEIYDELDELEEFVREENILMTRDTIIGLYDLLEALELKYHEEAKRIVDGGKK